MKVRNLLIIVVLSMLLTTVFLAATGGVNWSFVKDAQADQQMPPPQVCPLYVQPKLPEMPAVEPISDKMINDRKLAEEHLLNIIKEHRLALIETNKIIEASYQDYVKKCLDIQSGKSKQKAQ